MDYQGRKIMVILSFLLVAYGVSFGFTAVAYFGLSWPLVVFLAIASAAVIEYAAWRLLIRPNERSIVALLEGERR